MEITPIYAVSEHETLRVTESNRDSDDSKKRRNRRDRPAPGRPIAQPLGYEDFAGGDHGDDDDDDGVVSVLI